MASAFDIAKIQNYAVKNVNKIIGLTTLGLRAADDITVYQNIKEKTGLTTLKVGNLGQPYSLPFTPKANALSFGYRTIDPKMGKVDLEYDALSFYNTWLVQLTKPGVNESDLPYEKFFWEQIALALASEINQQSVYAGVRNTSGTTTADIADGFGKVFTDAISAGEISNVVATGTIDSSNAVSKFGIMCKALTPALREMPMNLYVPYNKYDAYCENYRDLHGNLPYNQQYEKFRVDGFSNVKIVPASWMNNVNRVILTKKENLIMGTDSLSDLNKIETVKQVRVLQIAMHFTVGYNFADEDVLYINDQA